MKKKLLEFQKKLPIDLLIGRPLHSCNEAFDLRRREDCVSEDSLNNIASGDFEE